jgi:hypothetical protein
MDMYSGRVWREYKMDIPLEQQAKEVWQFGRQLCRSNLILLCAGLQATVSEVLMSSLDRAELVTVTRREIGAFVPEEIKSFHARAKALGERSTGMRKTLGEPWMNAGESTKGNPN